MLPNVATHILHHTSRAAAAVQNQTHTIRNVLQLQSSSGPSTSSGGIGNWNGTGSSSSSWGSNGAGPGGAKYNAGSRFYNGYTGAGRAVTQANASTSHDTTSGQSDDNDEFSTTPVHLRARKTRARSHSLSIGIHGRRERAEKLGVLKTVQIHARSRHAFADLSHNGQLSSSDSLEPPSITSRPELVRRNSTTVPLTSESLDTLPPPPAPATSPSRAFSTDPAAPQTTTEPRDPTEEPDSDIESSSFLEDLRAARNTSNGVETTRIVQAWRSSPQQPTVTELNMAIQALHETRRTGEPLNPILEIYNEMVQRSVLPNIKTYSLMILALTDRDLEVHKVIASLESRTKRRALLGREEATKHSSDEERIAQLRRENNFGSAMSLFEALTSLRPRKVSTQVYNNLLRSSANNANVDAAIHVFAHMEARSDVFPTAVTYGHLITAFTNVGDLERAKEVFEEFQEAGRSNRISWMAPEAADRQASKAPGAQRAQLIVWNKMIEAYFRCGHPPGALDLLEKMMDSQAGEVFDPAHPPPPGSSTYTHIVAGFCQSGDVGTALVWFNRLLGQTAVAQNPFESSPVPTRPDHIAWITMLDALAMEGMVEELNELFSILTATAARDGLEVRAIDRVLLFHANIQYLNKHPDLESAKAVAILNLLVRQVLEQEDALSPVLLHEGGIRIMVENLITKYLHHGAPVSAIAFLEQHVDTVMRQARLQEQENSVAARQVHFKVKNLRNAVQTLTAGIMNSSSPTLLPFTESLRLVRLSDNVGLLPSRAVAPFHLHSYALAKQHGTIPDLTVRDWELLAYGSAKCDLPPTEQDAQECPVIQDYAFVGTTSILEDLAKHGVLPGMMNKQIVGLIIQAIHAHHGIEQLQQMFAQLGPEYEAVLNDPRSDLGSLRTVLQQAAPSDSVPLPTSFNPIRIDVYHGRFIDEFYPTHHTVTPLIAYSRFEAGIQDNLYPPPATLGRLINALGRLGELNKVRILYDSAQLVLASMENDQEWQSQAWFQIEDQMIIAYAHGGEMEAALVHRNRILEQGGSPTPDAYGALIQNVKDTTDDTSNAMALFQEAQAQGVTPNIYLYNTIISKLSKARKADYALELFQQMKANGIHPSSVTYGAVIAACARVGDCQSAELLFIEMASQRNFKPRIPPYNTMMQLYAHTKPDRERVLYYFEALKKAGIQPSAHSYKLLMDAYGTIEPVDTDAMENILNRVESSKISIQGSHWASMINAHGCVRKDLDRAIELFESIPSHPSSRQSSTPLPDAITFEALFNAIVTHRRTDLLAHYFDRLRSSGTHMTAYIANQIIKGYATGGELEKARAFFESLEDPPEGVAAPNNHVPHEDSPIMKVPASAPVYREPSTWEAMVRGELGNGHRDRAVALLERLQARKFPPAVYNRISGIMLDDSVSPWPASESPTSNSF